MPYFRSSSVSREERGFVMGGITELMWEKNSQQRKERMQEGEVGASWRQTSPCEEGQSLHHNRQTDADLDGSAHTCALVGAPALALFQISEQLRMIYDGFIMKQLSLLWKC